MIEMKFKRWYEMRETAWGTTNHAWFVVGPHGAIHVHIGVSRDSSSWGSSGGIECHWNHYQEGFNRAPDHLECQVTKRPCWHDGSSMYVVDQIVPMLNLDRIDAVQHRFVFDECERWYQDKIEDKRGGAKRKEVVG